MSIFMNFRVTADNYENNVRNQSSENALGIKSTIGCVVSDKSLALSELQLP